MGYWFGSWIVIIVWNVISPWPNEWWATWFFIQNIVVTAIVGAITTVWFTIGGTVDLRRLFKRLAAKEANIHDDGRVVDHISVADVALTENVEHGVIRPAHETPDVQDQTEEKPGKEKRRE